MFRKTCFDSQKCFTRSLRKSESFLLSLQRSCGLIPPMARSNDGTHSATATDASLVSATLQGDRDAYRMLVERYQERMLRMTLEILRNEHDAEDVVQESFVKAFLSLDKFKGDSSFFTWLYRITYNMAVDLKRRSQRRGGEHFEYKEHFGVSTKGDSQSGQPEAPSALANHTVEGPYEALIRKQTGSKLEEAFAQLSDEHRAVITLREVDGLDYEEIAQALGIPRGTVMSRLFYARKVLQRTLREIAPDGTTDGSNKEFNLGDNQQRTDHKNDAHVRNNSSSTGLKRAPG